MLERKNRHLDIQTLKNPQITTPAPHHSVFYRLDALPENYDTESIQTANTIMITNEEFMCTSYRSDSYVVHPLPIKTLSSNSFSMCGTNSVEETIQINSAIKLPNTLNLKCIYQKQSHRLNCMIFSHLYYKDNWQIDRVRVYVKLDTKKVILETFFAAIARLSNDKNNSNKTNLENTKPKWSKLTQNTLTKKQKQQSKPN